MYKLTELAAIVLALAGSGLACKREGGVKFTAYGFPDAPYTPKYHCQGSKKVPAQAGQKTILGTGTFEKPYAAAASLNSHKFKECDKIYVPLLKKYFKIQDKCENCTGQNEDDRHIDLYVAQFNKDVGQTQCELNFGNFQYGGNDPYEHEVITGAKKGFKVNTQPLFKNHKCFNKVSQGRIFPGRDGKVKCGPHGEAVEDADADAPPKGFRDEPVPVPEDGLPASIKKPEAGAEVDELPNENPDGVPDATKMMRYARAMYENEEESGDEE